jgi:anti-sigma factor RsiW
VELVTDYLEGALPARERERFDQHIGNCGKCAAYLEQMRTTIRLTGGLTEEAVDPRAIDAMLSVFRDWKQGTGSSV